jgi:hypothetical protein
LKPKAITVISSQAAAMNRFDSRSGATDVTHHRDAFFLCSLGSVAIASGRAPLVWPTAHWARSTPEAQGMSPSALADLVDFGAASPIDSILVVRHGHVVLDVYYALFRHGLKHAVNSVTKAVVGTLAGRAFKQGALGPLDTPVLRSQAEMSISWSKRTASERSCMVKRTSDERIHDVD